MYQYHHNNEQSQKGEETPHEWDPMDQFMQRFMSIKESTGERSFEKTQGNLRYTQQVWRMMTAVT